MQLQTRTSFRAGRLGLALGVVLSAAIAAGSLAANAAPAPSGPHLNYYGGNVISHVNVVLVIFGQGNYLSETTSPGPHSVSSFYRDVTNSRYLDWLSEYNTPTQMIGRGSFGGLVAIVPNVISMGSGTVDDALIQAELSYQILNSRLPAPQLDTSGRPNTLYAIFFPSSVTVTTSRGSTPANFCAYHRAFEDAGVGKIYYAVHPDLSSVTGCGQGTAFQNTTAIASQELIQAVTDPESGLARSRG